MSWTPEVISGKKREFDDISPEQTDLLVQIQKRQDLKDSPPPVMATLTDPAAILVLPEVPNPLTPDWAKSFQDSFFKKLAENTEEVKKLNTITEDVKKAQLFLNNEVKNLQTEQKKDKASLVKAEGKIEKLEEVCEGLTKQVSLLEEQVLRGDIKGRQNNLIFHGIMEKVSDRKSVV
jgi:hypothetical protein